MVEKSAGVPIVLGPVTWQRHLCPCSSFKLAQFPGVLFLSSSCSQQGLGGSSLFCFGGHFDVSKKHC